MIRYVNLAMRRAIRKKNVDAVESFWQGRYRQQKGLDVQSQALLRTVCLGGELPRASHRRLKSPIP